MLLLLGVAFVAGIVTAVSPCVLPVLPIVLAGGATGGKRRPYAIVGGLVASFTVFTLTATALLSEFLRHSRLSCGNPFVPPTFPLRHLRLPPRWSVNRLL